jgi:hypothetical protein
MASQLLVGVARWCVENQEENVETRKESGGKVDVLNW